MSLPRFLLTILIPPLAVYVRTGPRRPFWINLGLTLLFYIPGLLHALRFGRRR